MTDKPFTPPPPRPLTRYALTAEAYESLCSVRDELLLFAARAGRRATREPDILVHRNTLAHCFEHLAKRVDSLLVILSDTSDHPTNGAGASPPHTSELA
jgi:hypothetical protein